MKAFMALFWVVFAALGYIIYKYEPKFVEKYFIDSKDDDVTITIKFLLAVVAITFMIFYGFYYFNR